MSAVQLDRFINDLPCGSLSQVWLAMAILHWTPFRFLLMVHTSYAGVEYTANGHVPHGPKPLEFVQVWKVSTALVVVLQGH